MIQQLVYKPTKNIGWSSVPNSDLIMKIIIIFLLCILAIFAEQKKSEKRSVYGDSLGLGSGIGHGIVDISSNVPIGHSSLGLAHGLGSQSYISLGSSSLAGHGLGSTSGNLIDLGASVSKHITVTNKVGIPIPQPYPVHITKNVAVPVPHPVAVPVDQPYPVHVPKPYPVPVEKLVPYPVDRPVPYPVKVPVKVPVSVPVKVPVLKPYPVAVHKPVAVPVVEPIIVKKPVPVLIKDHGFGISSGYGFGGHGLSDNFYSHGISLGSAAGLGHDISLSHGHGIHGIHGLGSELSTGHISLGSTYASSYGSSLKSW